MKPYLPVLTIVFLLTACGSSTPAVDVPATLTSEAVSRILTAQPVWGTATMTPLPPTPRPTSTLDLAVTGTIAAIFTEAAAFQTAAWSPTSETGTPSPSIAPDPRSSPTQTPTPLVIYVLAEGECFDLDTATYEPEAACDVRLEGHPIFVPINGAKFSGQGSFAMPSQSDCEETHYNELPFAPQLNIYVCFQTNLGNNGYLVMLINDYNINRLIAIYWYLFPEN